MTPHSQLLLSKNATAVDILRSTNSGHLYQGAAPTDCASRNPAPYRCDGFATPTSADVSNTHAESFRHLVNHANTSIPTPDSSPSEAESGGAAYRSIHSDVARDDITSVGSRQTSAVKKEQEVATESHQTPENVKS